MAGVPVGAPLLLQARQAGTRVFRPAVRGPIDASTGGVVKVRMEPTKTTTYRWFMPATGYADANFFAPLTVHVR